MLRVLKLESGVVELHPEPVDLSALAATPVEALQSMTERQDVHLEFDPNGTPVQAHVDPGATERIVEELVRNAIDFSETGDRARVTVRHSPGTARFTVEDTGVGMDAEHLDQLFRPFEQASVGQDRTHEGTGLGLTVTHRLVHLMNGSIEIESEQGVGPRVVVTFPSPKASDSVPASRASESRTPTADQS